ncbi:MAG: LicD family protein [Spirochaetia bacterium]|nr:LicD family protein [Spirochaetia bacterium]
MEKIDKKYLEDLRKLQLLELKIAKEIKRVCEKNNISYFLVGGTLLGAVRHQGFIPWDDDMDIGMLRSDYKKFIEVCSRDLGDEFFLQTYQTDKAYGNFFAKIRLNQTHFTEYITSTISCHDGVFVDIFPYDFTSESEKERKKLISKINSLSNLYQYKKGYKMWSKDLLHMCYFYLCKFQGLFKTLSQIEDDVDKLLSLFDYPTYPHVISYFDCTRQKEYISISDLNNLKDYIFEDTTFKGPLDAGVYLTAVYGDYMELPPEENRYNRHDVVNLDFGSY